MAMHLVQHMTSPAAIPPSLGLSIYQDNTSAVLRDPFPLPFPTITTTIEKPRLHLQPACNDLLVPTKDTDLEQSKLESNAQHSLVS